MLPSLGLNFYAADGQGRKNGVTMGLARYKATSDYVATDLTLQQEQNHVATDSTYQQTLQSKNYFKRVIRLKSTKIRCFLSWPGVRLDWFPSGRARAVFSQAKAKGDH